MNFRNFYLHNFYLLSLISYLALIPCLSFAEGSPLLALPYTFAGRVLDWQKGALGDDSGIIIRVRNADGRVLSKCGTFTSTASPYNYRVTIPVANAPAEGCVTVGEAVVFEVEDTTYRPSKIYRGKVPAEKSVVAKSGGVCRVDICLFNDKDGDGVPDEYVSSIMGEMYDHDIWAWDPNADWDGDGKTNYEEWKAGTSPFSALDVFALRAAQAVDGMSAQDFFPITFFARPGRIYGVKATESLADADSWRHTAFRTEASGAAAETFYTTATAAGGNDCTVYVPKNDVKGEFYRVTVE